MSTPNKPSTTGKPADRFCRGCFKETISRLRLGDECFEGSSAKDAILQILPDDDSSLQDSDAVCYDCFETLKRTLKFIKTFKTASAKCSDNVEDQNDVIELSDDDLNEGSNEIVGDGGKTVVQEQDREAIIDDSFQITFVVMARGTLMKEEQFFDKLGDNSTTKTVSKTVDYNAFKENEAKLFNKLVVIPRAQQPVLDNLFSDIYKNITVFKHHSVDKTKNKRLLLLGNLNKYCFECRQIYPSLLKFRKHLLDVHPNKPAPKPQKCSDCDSTFESVEGKKVYMKKCTTLECPSCGEEMSSCQLLEHSKTEHLDCQPFKCKICKEGYESYQTYMDHKCGKTEEFMKKDRNLIKMHSNKPPESLMMIKDVRKCQFCEEHIKISDYKEHVATHRKYICRCKRSFLTLERLKEHQTAPCMFSRRLCNICGKFYTKGAMRVHLKTHEVGLIPVECETCHKKYSSQTRLMAHVKKTHRDNQEVICEFCGKKLRYSSMNGHIRLKHKSHQKYKCPIPHCEREFSRRDYVKKHVVTHQNNRMLKVRRSSLRSGRKFPGPDEFTCKFCLKSFKLIQNLKTHLVTHMRLVRYQCRHCPMTYSNYQGRLRHEKEAHLGVPKKGFRCNTCWRVEPTMDKLNRHMESVHKKKNYKCEYCGEAFSRYFQLNTHLLAEHVQPSDIQHEKEYVLRKALSDYVDFDNVDLVIGDDLDYEMRSSGNDAMDKKCMKISNEENRLAVSQILEENVEHTYETGY